ncbi:hypothetical protein Tco_0320643 [Tanacetum coccineum]
MPSAKSQSTANGSKPKPRSNTQTSRNWPASKNSFVTTKTVPIAEHSRNSRNFSDTKHFVCSTCQKCVFNANHDHCVTKFLNEVNSRAKVTSNKTTNRNKTVEQTSFAKKPERQITKGHRFSIKKTFVVHEKNNDYSLILGGTEGKIFMTVGLSANHNECILKYLSKVNSRASAQKKHAQSHKTTKRYIPVEKKSDSKNHGRQIPIEQRYSPNKSSNVYLKTTPPRSGLTWKPMGRIFTQVGLKWIPIRKSVETRYNTNDSASPLGKETHNPKTVICANSSYFSTGSNTLSWKPCQGGSSKLNLPDHRYKRRCCSLIPAESDSLPHAHAQTTKTYYKHQDSRIKKAQELKTKTSANSDIKDNSSETKLQGRLLESFQEDAKYEHVGQDTRSQGGKDDQDKQGKDLKISELKTKSKDNDKGSRSKITQHEGTSLQQR